ncbi:MAG: S1C family serine protease [Chitinophagaceae bacterium]
MRKCFFILPLLAAFASFAQKLTPVQIAERNKPGTVMVLATFKGTVTAIQPAIDEEALGVLAQQVRDELEAAGTFTTDLFWSTYIKAFSQNIEKYMTRGNERVSRDLNTTMVGSGFIITPDGYVITNAHVVDENDETTKQSFAEQAFQEIMEQDVKDLEKSMGRKLTEDEKKDLTAANSWYFSQTLEVGKIDKEFSVMLGISGKGGVIKPMNIPARLVTQGAAIPGKDVAILKLQRKHEYPTIRVGDDKEMRVGDQVYVLGYPAVATFHPLISEESISEATLTRGLVSARKNMKDGWEVLQTDASITHGNSGGPVMNEYGEVIGLATFGSIDQQRGQEVQGMNFIVPTTIVKEFIRKEKLRPSMSDISLAFEEAMDLFDEERYKKALEKFDDVKEMNPSFPFIDKYIKDTEQNIDKGMDREPQDYTLYYYIGGGVLLAGLLLFILLRRKKK